MGKELARTEVPARRKRGWLEPLAGTLARLADEAEDSR